MFVNVIKSHRDIVAVCDKELLGKCFEEGIFQLDVKENFYKGEDVPEEEAIRIMKSLSVEDSTFNIVGERSVKAAIKAGVIVEGNLNRIANIPFALSLL